MNDQNDSNQTSLTRRELKDLKVLGRFTTVYCQAHHRDQEKASLVNVAGTSDESELNRLPLASYCVCDQCREFLLYAFKRRLCCPLEEKPSCKHCEIHCFRAGHREKVREIMRFSGPYLIKRGRFDLLWSYLF
ncbi:MAG: nitrous oxide-stimulated promoter family protein [Desulfuromonadales bacterium]|nr:nitrous oxide-stimulated promoter family protein [Desulfuromonadales bacterium]